MAKTENIQCKYVFDEAEKRDIAQRMANQKIRANKLKEERKLVMADFKARIDEAEAAVNADALRLQNGFEMRDMPCIVVMDYEHCVVEYYRVDTKECVRRRKMEGHELQYNLPMDEQTSGPEVPAEVGPDPYAEPDETATLVGGSGSLEPEEKVLDPMFVPGGVHVVETVGDDLVDASYIEVPDPVEQAAEAEAAAADRLPGEFFIGDKVKWTSSGKEKEGEVVAVVQPNTEVIDPIGSLRDEGLEFTVQCDPGKREMVSYLVLVSAETTKAKPKLYWPKPEWLELLEDCDGVAPGNADAPPVDGDPSFE